MTARPDATLGADEREKFENWMSECGEWPHAVERKGESYRLSAAATAWNVWQARAALAAPAGSVATDEQIVAVANRWAKESGWMDFEMNDFLSCARALIAEFAAPAVVVSAEPVAEVRESLHGWPGRLMHITMLAREWPPAGTRLYATPVGPDAVDARDGERYRFLRDGGISELPFEDYGANPRVLDDSIVDAAMARLGMGERNAAIASTKPSTDEGASRG